MSNSPVTLTLIMIVKNESKIMTRCLDSIREYVDHIVISDTGSTDDTPAIIQSYLQKYNIPGKVYQDQWKNFGHNRSKSVENGKEWLSSQSINLSTNYFVTIDADMILKFLPSFKKEDLSEHSSWMIEQKNDSISYYNLRMFRSDLPYKCIGVTHEYWGCDDVKDDGRLDSVYIDDRGDGGCKSDKFTRDIALLTKGIEDEPDNERYIFYLAQSYSDSGDIDNGLKWYLNRIQAGGWIEEIYISHRRRGELWMKKGEPEKAIVEWLKAYECIPDRSETIFRIIQHFRINGDNHLALSFLRMALPIPYPEEYVLFIEHPIYCYRLAEEFSIIAYYVGKKQEGNIACQLLLLNKDVPQYVKDSVFNNSYFYIQKLNAKRHYQLSLSLDEPYQSSSSCLMYNDNKDNNNKNIQGVVRAVNYSMDDRFKYSIRDTKGIVRTKNFWLEMKDENDLNPCEIYEIEFNEKNENNPPRVRDSHVKGFEDIRICHVGDKIFGIAVDWEYGRMNHPSVVYFSLVKNHKNKDKYWIDRVKPIQYRDDICQKNWVLYSENGKLFAVYSHHPLTIIELDIDFVQPEKVVLEKYSPYDLSRVRGSSIPIKIGSERLFITHEVIHRDTRKYYHRFLTYDMDWNITKISEPFYFGHFYVEFSLSVMYNDKGKDKTIIIPYSTKDNTTEFVEIDYDDVKWLPLSSVETINEWISLNIN